MESSNLGAWVILGPCRLVGDDVDLSLQIQIGE